MAKLKHTPRSRKLLKWIIERKFDPHNVSQTIRDELESWVVPSSDYIMKSVRGKYIKDLESDSIEYVAFHLARGKTELKLVARMYYFIEYAQDPDVTKQELYNDITELDEFGFIPSAFADYLKPKQSIKQLLMSIKDEQ